MELYRRNSTREVRDLSKVMQDTTRQQRKISSIWKNHLIIVFMIMKSVLSVLQAADVTKIAKEWKDVT